MKNKGILKVIGAFIILTLLFSVIDASMGDPIDIGQNTWVSAVSVAVLTLFGGLLNLAHYKGDYEN
jgi:hypothetical protein